uniref:Uncharacterized protein n=1 Tax=Anguilla anguilla TaxID=7936 RepID=A0A0E9RN04_ANGAN
MSLLKFYSSF